MRIRIFLLICLLHILSCVAEESESTLLQLLRTPRQLRCSKDEFSCSNGQCIDSYQVCDGAKDCRDGTDETQAVCTKIGLKCPSFSFRCAYGACVDKDVKCDGKQDCADNSDELLPECLTNVQKPPKSRCKKNEFSCISGQCINEFSVCDGISDCSDGTDETITQCVNIRCPSFSFQCAYGACIDLEKKCNGVTDCSDGSDEDDELCEYNTNSVTEKKPTRRPTASPSPPPSPQPQPSGGCLLPDKSEGTNFKVEGCQANDRTDKCKGVSGAWVPELAVMTLTCDRGYALPQSNNVFCLNGMWKPQLGQCQKMCKPLLSESMDLKCSYLGSPVPCDRPAAPGTKVQPKCKTAFHISDPAASYKETECREDGFWNLPLFKCVADCGKPSYNSGKPLIAFGSETVIGEYPWHAGLYFKKNGVFTHFCGGTIINPHIILTAAHCIYNETSGTVYNANDIQTAVGKYSRSWEVKDPHEQRIRVKEIIPLRTYRGRVNSYAQDIAALDLMDVIVLSNAVLPACIDWTSEMTFSVGMIGTVVGWGFNEKDTPSEELKSAKLPYMDFDTCRERSPGAFLPYITYDKFCAGNERGSSVQQGDSGGGITFVRHNKLHFIYGIVSIKPKDVNTFAAYTNITDHIEWLDRVVNAVNQRHSN